MTPPLLTLLYSIYIATTVTLAADIPLGGKNVSQSGSNGNWKVKIPDELLANFTEELFTLEERDNAANDWVHVFLDGMPSDNGKGKRLLGVNNKELDKKKTVRKLRALFDNYSPDVNEEEIVTVDEEKEETAFLESVLETPIFGKTKKFILENSVLTESNFNHTLRRIWFGQYGRGRGRRGGKKKLGSSGFEHVFLGEVKKKKVSGFHNWIFFADQEEKGNLHFQNFIKFVHFGNRNKSWIKESFNWLNYSKPISSMFVGTSPEFDLSIFTTCWLVRRGKCSFRLDGKKFSVQSFTIPCGDDICVGSAYANDAELTQLTF